MLRHKDIQIAVAAIVICFALATRVGAQGSESSAPILFGGSVGIDGSECETTKTYLHSIARAAGADKSIIIIASLGKREFSRKLNRRRLKILSEYLTTIGAVEENRVITAESERAQGLGQVEVYVGGRLFITFTLKRNKDFAAGCATS